MEFQVSFVSMAVSLLFFLFMVLKIVKIKNSKLPPGPWQLPLIGNIHQFVGLLPHRILRDLSNKYGPLMSIQLGQISVVVVSSPEIAKEIMKTHDVIFAQRPYLLAADILAYNSSDLVHSSYGNYWRQLRKICTLELFSSKRVQKFRSIREEEVLNLLKTISRNERSRINLSRELFLLTIGITARATFGKKCKDQEAFSSILKDVFKLASGFSVADMYPSVKLLQVISGVRPRLEKLHKEMDKILENIVSEHKDRKKAGDREVLHEDFVDVLLRIQKHGEFEFPLTDRNIKAVIFDIFTAGSESSSTTTMWAMSEMLKNPRVIERAQAEVRKVFNTRKNVDETGIHELKYLKMVIKETLRLHPPGPLLIPRECSEECQINGYKIPVKTKVIVNAWAIGRDSRFWAEAESFKPERFQDSSVDFKGADFEYIPFGAGRRICPGILFALPNIELPLAQLLYHFDWKLPEGLKSEELDMTETFGSMVGRKEDLHVIPIAYNHSHI